MTNSIVHVPQAANTVQTISSLRVVPPGFITELKPNQVFVFGSNTDGVHVAGAAKTAHQQFGAIWGVPRGLFGQSYAICVTDLKVGTYRSYPITQIEKEVNEFLDIARKTPDLEFLVTAFGTEKAGYEIYEIAHLFYDKIIPQNVLLPQSFIDYLMNLADSNDPDNYENDETDEDYND
jgi:hypothetical protein